MRTVRVDLADRSYDVVVGQDLLGAPGPHLAGLAGRAFLITDQTVASTWAGEAERGLRTAGLDPGLLESAYAQCGRIELCGHPPGGHTAAWGAGR